MEAGSPSLSEALAELEQTRPLDLREVQKLRDTFDEMYGRMQDLDRLKSEFLATISHELRTPLNSVIGYAELILSGVNGPIDEEMEKDVQAIYENGHQLLRLVNDLLDLAKIEAGHLELEMVRMDPVSLVEALYEDHLEAVEGKGLRLLRQSASDLPQIWGDPVRMQQIFANLISNSVKFTEEGYVRILARRQDNWVAIDVEDTGIGIARPDLDTIFERFRQLDGSLTRRAEGTGLGLAIGRHLVRMHGGRMVVDSTLGEGTTVTVFLPIAESPPNPTAVTIGTIL
jgi:signal transduction histidine kinase